MRSVKDVGMEGTLHGCSQLLDSGALYVSHSGNDLNFVAILPAGHLSSSNT